jgi:hypothetical protein
VITLPVRDEGSDADDRVVDVLREFFAHRLAACCERLLRPPFKMGIYTAFWNGATVIDCIL